MDGPGKCLKKLDKKKEKEEQAVAKYKKDFEERNMKIMEEGYTTKPSKYKWKSAHADNSNYTFCPKCMGALANGTREKEFHKSDAVLCSDRWVILQQRGGKRDKKVVEDADEEGDDVMQVDE